MESAVRPLPSRDLLRPLRYLWRTPLLLLHLLLALPLTVLLINRWSARLQIGHERLDHRVIRWWQGSLVRLFGLRVRRIGKPRPGAVLFVANHVSWLDISVLHGQAMMGFVAKKEISRWPLVGWLASLAGTIYHHRGSNESLAGVMHQMLQRLQDGEAVGVFPEGRTTSGERIETFHARIFQPAVLGQVPAQPVALRYGAGGAAQTHIAFRPKESFLGNFLRVLGEPSRPLEVHFLEPVAPVEDGRRRMAEACRARIAAAMELPPA